MVISRNAVLFKQTSAQDVTTLSCFGCAHKELFCWHTTWLQDAAD